MVKSHGSEVLRDLGFQMVLQIHDELIFMGPAVNAAEALQVVREIMEHPFLDGKELSVPLPVDAKIATTWMEGKGGGPMLEPQQDKREMTEGKTEDEDKNCRVLPDSAGKLEPIGN